MLVETRERLEKELDERPRDWDLRKVLSDVYEELGWDSWARFMRELADKKKSPNFCMRVQKWGWSYPNTGKLLDDVYKLYVANEWMLESTCQLDYKIWRYLFDNADGSLMHDSRLEAEMKLMHALNTVTELREFW